MTRIARIIICLLFMVSVSLLAQLGPKIRGFSKLHIGWAPMGLSASPNSHWRMDEAAGNSRLDSIGTNHLADYGCLLGTGKINGAAEWDGGVYLAAGGIPFYEPGDSDFTWCGWVYFNNHGAGDTMMQLASTYTTLAMAFYTDSTNFIFGVRSNTPGATLSTTVTNIWNITNNVWNFVVAYHDSVNNVIGVSVNNSAVTTAPHGGGITTIAGNTLKFGQRVDSGGGYLPTGSRLDSWSYFDHRLTPSEISYMWNSGNGRDWPF